MKKITESEIFLKELEHSIEYFLAQVLRVPVFQQWHNQIHKSLNRGCLELKRGFFRVMCNMATCWPLLKLLFLHQQGLSYVVPKASGLHMSLSYISQASRSGLFMQSKHCSTFLSLFHKNCSRGKHNVLILGQAGTLVRAKPWLNQHVPG